MLSELLRLSFNLYLNAAFSFLAGYLIVSLTLKLFRVNDSPAKLLLLCFPFGKIAFDLIRGIPRASTAVLGLDPLSLPPHHQMLLGGANLSWSGPQLSIQFDAIDDLGRHFSVSVADYLYSFLSRKLWAGAPGILLAALLGVSLALIVRRLIAAARFESNRRSERETAREARGLALGRRKVDLYVSDDRDGSPFTGGIIRPYICFPGAAWDAISATEREAVISHELAHIQKGDLLGTWLVQLLGDLFWFVPGYRGLSARIDRLREILADHAATRAGASGAHLASALLTLSSKPAQMVQPALYSAFFRERSILSKRVRALVGEEVDPRSRLGWSNPWVRALAILWTLWAVMGSTFGGNHVPASPVTLQDYHDV